MKPPVYPPDGVQTFRQDIIENAEFINNCKTGICPMCAAFDKGKIIGVISIRKNKTHINLLFVKKEYHRRGVATALFRFLLESLLRENPELEEITVNSSPYGKGFYLNAGFAEAGSEQLANGIRYISR